MATSFRILEQDNKFVVAKINERDEKNFPEGYAFTVVDRSGKSNDIDEIPDKETLFKNGFCLWQKRHFFKKP